MMYQLPVKDIHKRFKAVLLLSCLFLIVPFGRAQYVPIPDAGFRNCLFNTGFGSCFDGTQTMLDTTCSLVVNATELELNSSCDSLEGLQYFHNLRRFYAGNGPDITYIPMFPARLREISFYHPFLGDTLPPLPDSLEIFKLAATDSQLYIPAIPESVTQLGLEVFTVNNMPQVFPPKLTELEIVYSPIDVLPPLPDSLRYLELVVLPNLPSLPVLPPKLDYFSLYDLPMLTQLPEFTDSLTIIELYKLPLFTLGKLPKKLEQLNCVDNFMLNCLPLLPDSLEKLDIRGTGITCLPNTPANANFTYQSDFNIQVCNGANGLVCDSVIDCDPTDVVAIAVAKMSILFPGELTEIFVAAGNNCAAGISGKVRIIIDGPVIYQAPLPGAMVPAVNGDTLTYTIDDFGNFSALTSMQFTVMTDTTFGLNPDSVRFILDVLPDGGDSHPANDRIIQWMTILNSHDPNIKEVSPLSILPVQAEAHTLTYTVHFQNTGSAAAQNIVVRDTLDEHLDTATLKVLMYSHALQTFTQGNAIRFVFPNIKLSDSTSNEKESHGYVQYSIKTKPQLPAGTVIHNTASIYFDFNTPVVTNTTENTVRWPTAIVEEKGAVNILSVYPNPSTDNIRINWPGEEGAPAVIYNTLGKKELTLLLHQGTTVVDIQHLPTGVYYIGVTDKSAMTAQRFLKY